MILRISKRSNYLCKTGRPWLERAWSIETEISGTVSLVARCQCEIGFQFSGEDRLVWEGYHSM
jgi:hypothetical protein